MKSKKPKRLPRVPMPKAITPNAAWNKETDKAKNLHYKSLPKSFLEVVDNLERAIKDAEETGADDASLKGIRLTHKVLLSVLEKMASWPWVMSVIHSIQRFMKRWVFSQKPRKISSVRCFKRLHSQRTHLKTCDGNGRGLSQILVIY